MSLPFLPGNSFDKKVSIFYLMCCYSFKLITYFKNIFQVGQNKHHLSHHFDKYNGVNMMVGERKPGVGGEPLAGQDLRPRNSVYPRGIFNLSFLKSNR